MKIRGKNNNPVTKSNGLIMIKDDKNIEIGKYYGMFANEIEGIGFGYFNHDGIMLGTNTKVLMRESELPFIIKYLGNRNALDILTGKIIKIFK